jgi:hypothetical protein
MTLKHPTVSRLHSLRPFPPRPTHRGKRRSPDLAHRADPKGRVSEKWIRFSAPNDALFQEEHRIDPKSGFHF